MSRRLPDVVFARPIEAGRLRVECRRCGDALTLDLPLNVTDLADTTQAFIRQHRPCQRALAADQKAAP